MRQLWAAAMRAAARRQRLRLQRQRHRTSPVPAGQAPAGCRDRWSSRSASPLLPASSWPAQCRERRRRRLRSRRALGPDDDKPHEEAATRRALGPDDDEPHEEAAARQEWVQHAARVAWLDASGARSSSFIAPASATTHVCRQQFYAVLYRQTIVTSCAVRASFDTSAELAQLPLAVTNMSCFGR